MNLAATFSERGVIIVEYALAASDVDRLAAEVPLRNAPQRRPAPAPMCARLARHAVLRDLVQGVAGAGLNLAHASLVHHVARQPWRTGWQPASDLATHPTTELVMAIALDAIGEDHGPWEVQLGSHLDTAQDAQSNSAICLLQPGDIIVLHPRVLLRAQRGRSPTGRRLVQLDFATPERTRPGIWTGPAPGHA